MNNKNNTTLGVMFLVRKPNLNNGKQTYILKLTLPISLRGAIWSHEAVSDKVREFLERELAIHLNFKNGEIVNVHHLGSSEEMSQQLLKLAEDPDKIGAITSLDISHEPMSTFIV